MRKLKQLSQWARAHQKKALVIVVSIKLILILLSYFVGNYLKNSGYSFGPVVFISLVLLFTITVIAYPRRKKNLPFQWYFYEKQKASDFLITLCYFFMMCWLFNQERIPALQTISMAVAPASEPPAVKKTPAQEILSSLSYRNKSSLTRKEKRILKNEFKKQMIIFGKATIEKDKDKARASWQMILAIIGAVALSLLLAALVCSISCGGSDGAAILVAILGLTAIIFGLIFLIKAIKKSEKKRQLKKKEEAQTPLPST